MPLSCRFQERQLTGLVCPVHKILYKEWGVPSQLFWNLLSSSETFLTQVSAGKLTGGLDRCGVLGCPGLASESAQEVDPKQIGQLQPLRTALYT